MIDLVDAPATPTIILSPDRHWMLVLENPALPTLTELSQPELRLAGLRINPLTSGPSRSTYHIAMSLKRLPDGVQEPVEGLPTAAKISHVSWSPDSRKVAFTVTTDTSILLWLLESDKRRARQLIDRPLNAAYYNAPLEWMPDSKTILCTLIPEERPDPPEDSLIPTSPVIQQSEGKSAPAPTYQDLLKNAHDVQLFEYYFSVRIVLADLSGTLTYLGEPALYRTVEPSPDGLYLLTEIIHPPYSYQVPAPRFPHRVEIRDRKGVVLKELADLPLADQVPIAFDAVPEGPRNIGWRADVPHTVYWCEAQDGGDPKRPAEIRDKVWSLSAPFTSDPEKLINLSLRYSTVYWGDSHLALVQEWQWKDRLTRIWAADPDKPAQSPVLFAEYSLEDRYNDPGIPLLTPTANGTYVLRMTPDRQAIYLRGEGASPEGNFPFLDQRKIRSAESKRIWRCRAPYYEFFIDFLDEKAGYFLTRRESVDEQPNYYLHTLRPESSRAITEFPNPAPQLKGVQKELIRYQRKDGIELTATLYTPAGWERSKGTLPVLLWAYPQEFKSSKSAGQVTDTPYRFIRISPLSPLYWLLRGYAIADNPAMPIIGEGNNEPNDTYVEQLVASAEAIVAELVRRGVADSTRLAIGGHSYGAFMTANLLSHTNLFQAGIARSGAYNRTLTPFGFQSEERILWEAPETYLKMSPFMHVQSMNTPLLLIHGEADNNTGTFPMQSERYFAALKGLGKPARLVLLPKESHGYRARESVLHMLWEMDQWLERYLGRRP
jgi:dipeptidyl aminopeptidase/acylaminoacyl peptidase